MFAIYFEVQVFFCTYACKIRDALSPTYSMLMTTTDKAPLTKPSPELRELQVVKQFAHPGGECTIF